MSADDFCTKVIEEVNKVRLNPKTYSNKIKGYLPYFKGNILSLPQQPGVVTNEGPEVYKEAAEYLLSLPKLQPLTIDSNLCSIAQNICDELSKYDEFEQMDNVDRESIINQYGTYEGNFGESSDFGSLTPELVVLNLLVDDGNPNRNNRKMLFKENFRKIGCGNAPHNKFENVTVIIYTTNFIPNSELKLKNNNKTNLSYTKHGTSSGKYTKIEEDYPPEYVKEIKTEQDVYISGIPYRYVKNVDPNKDLITDSAKYGFPVNIKPGCKNTTNKFVEEKIISGSKSINPQEHYYNNNQNREYENIKEENNKTTGEEFPDMLGVSKIEQSEKIVYEGGKKIKLIKTIKYMDNGEIKTEIHKAQI